MTATDSLFSSLQAVTPVPPRSTAFPLSMASVGAPVRLVEVRASRKLTHRLAEMGITTGVILTVIQDAGGPLLVAVRGSRVAIGRGIAHHLQVLADADDE